MRQTKLCIDSFVYSARGRHDHIQPISDNIKVIEVLYILHESPTSTLSALCFTKEKEDIN